VQRSQDQFLIS